MINLCVFEDSGYLNLYPLTFSKPAYDLLVGCNTLFEKIHHHYTHINITLHCRDYLTNTQKTAHPGFHINKISSGSACLFLNGRAVYNDALHKEIQLMTEEDHNGLLTQNGQVVALYLHGALIHEMKALLNKIAPSSDLIQQFRPHCVTRELEEVKIINSLWELLGWNSAVLQEDFNTFSTPGIIKGDIGPLCTITQENQVSIDKNTVVEDFVYLDSSKGPIIIEHDVHIESHSRLQGPLYIGAHSTIRGARVKNSSIGPHCKIGGEVSDSVFLRYSNKGHEGYTGNSYVGEWVNIGAMSTTSNLKNNYKPIKMQSHTQMIDTDQQFLGTVIGDHVKLGIGSLLDAGTVIGLGSSLYGPKTHPKYIPPFTWGTAGTYTLHQLNKLLETAGLVMSRRNVNLSDAHIELLSLLHEKLSPVSTKIE